MSRLSLIRTNRATFNAIRYLPFVLFLAIAATAQDPGVIPAFTTIEPHEYDTINLATLGIRLNAPVRSKAGHIPISYQMGGNVTISKYVVGNTGYFQIAPFLSGQELHLATGGVAYGHQSALVYCGGTQHASRTQWYYTDQNGSTHPLPNTIILWDSSVCGATSATAYTTDGSGIYVSFNYALSGYAIDGDGNNVNFHSGPGSFTDPNGNSITGTQSVSPPYPYTVVDTLGQTVATSTVSTNGSQTITWSDAAGNTQSFDYYTEPLTAYTWFGCSWNNPGTTTSNFPSQVVFPDQSTLSYSWETVYNNSSQYTGRISSVTLPTGAQIKYAYSGGTHGVNCADGTTASMTRTTPDGQWTYAHVPANGSPFPGPGTTTVTDPQSNNVVYTFTGLTFPINGTSGVAVETEKQVYNGAVSPANLIQTVITCYNNPSSTPTNCRGTLALPVTEKDVYTTYSGVTGYSAVKTAYDTYGRVTDVKVFDFNASTPTNEKQIAYGTGSPSSQTCSPLTNTYIINKPCSITLLDSQHSNAVLGQTWNSYDGNGNLLQTWNLVSGSGASGTYLSKQFTYDSHGVVQTATDVNGQVMNYRS